MHLNNNASRYHAIKKIKLNKFSKICTYLKYSNLSDAFK